MSVAGAEVVLQGAEAIGDAVDLARTCYGNSAEPEGWWRWWLFDRGTGSSTIAFARSGGQPVGMQAFSMVPYRRGSVALTGAVLTCAMVLPQFRRQGVFRALVEASVEEAWRLGAIFVTTMPNEGSYPAFRSFGWTDPGERTLFVKLRPGNRAAHDDGTRFTTELVESLDLPALDRMVNEAPGDGTLAPERGGSWLRWRYRGNPLSRYVLMECRDRGGSLRSAAVGTTRRVKGVAVGLLVDLLGAPGPAAARVAGEMGACLRRNGALLVATVAAGRNLRRDLELAGFRPVPGMLAPRHFRTVYLIRAQAAEETRPPASIEDWRLTLADWDGI